MGQYLICGSSSTLALPSSQLLRGTLLLRHPPDPLLLHFLAAAHTQSTIHHTSTHGKRYTHRREGSMSQLQFITHPWTGGLNSFWLKVKKQWCACFSLNITSTEYETEVEKTTAWFTPKYTLISPLSASVTIHESSKKTGSSLTHTLTPLHWHWYTTVIDSCVQNEAFTWVCLLGSGSVPLSLCHLVFGGVEPLEGRDRGGIYGLFLATTAEKGELLIQQVCRLHCVRNAASQ